MKWICIEIGTGLHIPERPDEALELARDAGLDMYETPECTEELFEGSGVALLRQNLSTSALMPFCISSVIGLKIGRLIL